MTNIDELLQVFDCIRPVPEVERQALSQIGIRISVKKGDYLFREGDYYPNVGVIATGLMKRTFLRDDGREFIHYFAVPFAFVGSFSSVIQGLPANVSTIALEDTEIVGFNYKHFNDTFYDRDPVWNYLGRKITENLFIKREDRERQFMLNSAEQRYKRFRQDFGKFEHRLSQTDISAYLGITPEAFSRLKAKMNT